MAREILVIGGRRFVAPPDSTLAQDAWVQALALETGVVRILTEPDETRLATLQGALARLEQMMSAIIGSGRIGEYLAGFLVELDPMAPAGAEPIWNRARAIELAQWFDELRDPEGKEFCHQALRNLIAGFFDAGVPYSTPSPSSGETVTPTTMETRPTTTATTPKRPKRTRSRGHGASGPTSSASSPTTPASAPASSPTGA